LHLRICSLQTEVNKTRKRETEDTKVLENAVKMVEENLQTTTVSNLIEIHLYRF